MNFHAPRDTTVSVSATPLPRLADLGAIWCDLESRAEGTFFTSWTWIGAWLATFRPDGSPPNAHLIVARAGALVVGLALIGERTTPSFLKWRHIAALHQSGIPDDDAIFIEFNDFLLDRDFAERARGAMLDFVARKSSGWREIKLSGITPALRRAVSDGGLPHRLIHARPCPWIALAKVPPGISGYLAILSKNTRQQIQRSLRLYEAEGGVTLTLAASLAEAREMLKEMRVLHQKSWRDRRGHGGAFASARFVRFAEQLTTAGVPAGSVQLLRVSAGAGAIGYLLNFIHDGHVYAYQSAFAYRADNRFRPGLVTHALAVVQAREQGLRGYHFMAGDGRYKTSLANAEEHLFWMTLRHDDLFSRAEDCARALKARVTGLVRGLNG
jgi:CelD/BcsL family acetyltransferase involved in cellulose biosynthesis